MEDSFQSVLAIKDNYFYQTRQWVAWMRETGNHIDEIGIANYFKWLNNESKLAAGTIRSRRQAVKKRVRTLYRDVRYSDRMKLESVLSDLDTDFATAAPKIQQGPVSHSKVLSVVEYREMLSRARSERQGLFMTVLWETGMSVSEMTSMKLAKCEIGDTTVEIRIIGKGRKERKIRIRRELYNRCREVFRGAVYLLETSGGKRYQRSYVSAQITTMGKRIGRKISAHSLRHSWATRMVAEYPGKISAVSGYLGHSTPNVTLSMYYGTELTDRELFADSV